MNNKEISNKIDYAVIEEKIFEILSYHTKKYLMNDSSSIDVETSARMYSSICYLVKLYFENGGDYNYFVNNPYEAFKQSFSIIEKKIDIAKRIYCSINRCDFLKNNFAFNDTLKEIEKGFRFYDYRYFADEFPSSITYWLSNGVNDDLKGIDYIIEYLTRLKIEMDFSSHFESSKAEELLKCAYGDFNSVPLNTFDVILINCFGLSIVNKNVDVLFLINDDKDKIKNRLFTIKKDDYICFVAEKVQNILFQIGLINKDVEEYLKTSLINLFSVIINGVKSNNLDNLFFSN